MSSVVERLVESWLDSQTERRYQSAFVQMLVSEGWTVLHSTRHSALEFGKDVVARAPDGELHAFQLKGNPGSRLTKGEAQGLVPQLHELTTVPLPDNFRKGRERHRAILVTNGEIDEEAQTMFGLIARDLDDRSAAKSFTWWGRGDLLSLFLSTSRRVWPTSLEGNQALLNLMAAEGSAPPDFLHFTRLLLETAPKPLANASSASIRSGLTALLLMAEIAKSKWYDANNHFALYQLTVLAAVYASQFIRGQRKRKALVRDYAAVALSHATDLIVEAKNERFEPDTTWSAGNVLADVDIMWHRRNLVAECGAVLLLAHGDQSPILDVPYVRALIEASLDEPKLWGEGAIPSTLLRYWGIYRWGGIALEYRLGGLLSLLMSASREQLKNVQPPASPYYGFKSCWARAAAVPWMAEAGIFEESFVERTWTAKTLMYVLAKRNMKQTCKSLWSDFTYLLHESIDIDPEHFFDCRLAEEGTLNSRTYMTLSWGDLLKEAQCVEATCTFLHDFEDMPWLVAAYVAAVPYRAWEPVMMWLDRKLCRTWY